MLLLRVLGLVVFVLVVFVLAVAWLSIMGTVASGLKPRVAGKSSSEITFETAVLPILVVVRGVELDDGAVS